MNINRSSAIVIQRSIQAPPARIYAAFTKAEGWISWCCEKAETEARLGGKLHIYTEGYHANGQYTLLIPDREIAFTWDGDREPPTAIHVALTEEAKATHLVFSITILPSEGVAPEFNEFLERIWGHALDNLKDVLEK